MNPFRHVSERWFWRALYALILAWAVHIVATDPGPRPTEPIASAEAATAEPADELVPVVRFDALTPEGAGRFNGKPRRRDLHRGNAGVHLGRGQERRHRHRGPNPRAVTIARWF